MVTLNRLRYFAAVANAGSVSEAARDLGMAQPALSGQIRALEDALGQRLLRRHSRGVELTEAGQHVLRYAAEFAELQSRMSSDLQRLSRGAGRTVKMGLPPSLIKLIGVDLLLAASEHPGLQLELVEGLSKALIQSLERREIDFAFAYDAEQTSGLIREPILRDDLLFVTAAGQADGPITFAEAISHELSFAGDHGIVATVRRIADRLNLVPRIDSKVQSVATVHDRIIDGGASLLSYGSAAEGVQGGYFAVRRIVEPSLSRTLYVVRPNDAATLASDAAMFALSCGMVQRILRCSAPYATLLDQRFAAA